MDKQKIKDLVGHENAVILEIGSDNGQDAVELYKLFSNATIYCFEADPRAYAGWISNCGMYERIFLNRVAVGNHNGPIKFNLANWVDTKRGGKSNSCSLRQPKNHLDKFDHVKFDEQVEVECIRLDDWMWAKELVDFVWMDVNGAEEDVILGGIETFKEQVRFLRTEYSEHELFEGQLTQKQLLDLLEVYEIIDDHYDPRGYGDVLLRNKNL